MEIKLSLIKMTVTVIKLGGSVITDKTKPFSTYDNVIREIARDIKDVNTPIVVVHGGGSFGHPVAKKYKDVRTAEAFAKIQDAMQTLNRKIVKLFIEEGVNASSYQTSASVVLSDGRIKDMFVKPIEKMLDLGLVPIIYGDVVCDESNKYSILSGDQIIVYLAKKLNAKKIILVSNIKDIVYTKDPTKSEDAEPIKEVTPESFKELKQKLEGPEGIDVTGGIKEKLVELVDLAKEGVESEILNKRELKKALKGEKHTATVIHGE
jgi:isopentenyl phosphate kinase